MVNCPTKIECLSPGLVLGCCLVVTEILDLSGPDRGPEVEYLSVSSSQELPRVPSSIAVSWISAYEYPGLASSVVLLVDGVFVTESVIPG